ncbi:hypothetical protein TGMAS_413170 [Toxoplasma gondii MAS]|uniref:Uncharacterized protein n=1 Tax=Toxoplasma gondii MAS TaxID=943118 RepID=A0A086QWG8_TOXGO|nr:hypothetical protein TGMAS_413170 [Toxoplasma gondii MAS]
MSGRRKETRESQKSDSTLDLPRLHRRGASPGVAEEGFWKHDASTERRDARGRATQAGEAQGEAKREKRRKMIGNEESGTTVQRRRCREEAKQVERTEKERGRRREEGGERKEERGNSGGEAGRERRSRGLPQRNETREPQMSLSLERACSRQDRR